MISGRRGGRGSYYKNLCGRKRGRGDYHGNHGGSSYHNNQPQPAIYRGVRDVQSLSETLSRLEGANYKAYHGILGCWQFSGYRFYVDKIQSDPFAPPSLCRVQMDQSVANYPEFAISSKTQCTATADYLTRWFSSLVHSGGHDKNFGGGGWHGKKGGDIRIDIPSQHVLERTSCLVTKEQIEVRFTVSLPAHGRTIEGNACRRILTENLPGIIEKALPFQSQDKASLQRHVELVEDQTYLRAQLSALNLVAFVRDGAVLPRMSGADDRPMSADQAVLFQSPLSMRVDFKLPHSGRISGMGIPKGVSLIVGGGFHGKSTLLNAIEMGVYDHVPGDGREFVVTDSKALKIRAEDGRSIEKVDIRPFINNLPFGRDTSVFSTQDASGSTSQAGNIIEGLEAGATCLLIDEDTSATNFMIRDSRMQELVAADKEPITPFIAKVRSLYDDFGVSTILVMGGSGDYFQVAGHVIMMDCYQAHDVTQKAKSIAAETIKTNPQTFLPFNMTKARIPLPQSLDASSGDREKVRVRGKTQFGFQVEFGNEEIDLSGCEQVVEKSQTHAIGDSILHARNNFMDGGSTMASVLQRMEADFNEKGLDVLCPHIPLGNYSRPRPLEIAAAINRYRSLRIK
ncbi:uncharacterized protein LOC5511282 [Nematostella vectensis]|uniref:uncharacterized protein LOC5511282 n=1 Tax=Nematostella vectensis TaxID=45351 RepID=UPI0020778281|nr:uncharacterized protein LOC5511282 [Nematostella vectensis]